MPSRDRFLNRTRRAMVGSVGGSSAWGPQGLSAGYLSQKPQDMFKKLDTNGDGGIRLEEFQAGAPKGVSAEKSKELFAQIDTNGDGKIDASENEAFMKKMQEQMSKGTPPSIGSNDSSTQLQDLLSALKAPSNDNGDSFTKALEEFLKKSKEDSTKYGATGGVSSSVLLDQKV